MTDPYTVYWHHEAPLIEGSPGSEGPPGSGPPLDRAIELDVMIVGGGFTGLSTAIHLKEAEPTLRIGLFESRYIGWGASGRNTGFLTSLVGHDLHTVRQKLGDVRGAQVARFGVDAIDTVESLIQRFDIDCHYHNTGLANPGLSAGHMRRADKLAAAAQAFGLDHQRWDMSQVQDRLGTPLFSGAFYQPYGGVLQPFRLVRGLLDAARSMGVEIYQQSAVRGLQLGQPVRATVNGHTVTAKHAVIATNAYTEDRHLRWTYAPLHVYSIVTEPLSDAQIQRLGWAGREGFYTLHHILYALRLTDDNRIVAATGNVHYYWNNARHVARQPGSYKNLEDAIGWHWPQLGPVRTAFRWEGVLANTLSDFPVIGWHKRHRNVLHGVAFCGHGVSLANHGGKVLADLFLDRTEPWSHLPFVNKAPFPPSPGEPLRKPIAMAYIGVLRALDWWANKPHR